MSVVYRAIHKSIESEVAIKVMRQPGSQDMVKRFFNEAVAASQIRHPGIVHVFDYGQHTDGTAYLVMELLQGENLGDRLRRRGSLDPLEAARLMRQVCGALGAAHDAEIIHRDVKPHNIFIVRDADIVGGERVKVLDFGVAKLAMPGRDSDETDTLIGTPLYMAPEQILRGGRTDVRTDVYQVGAVLYHMIEGRPPSHRAVDPLGPHAPARLTSRSGDLAMVIQRCLEHDPSKRYPDMRALEEALRWCLSEPIMSVEDSPTVVQHTFDLNRSERLLHNAPGARGLQTLASASVASGFFRGAPITGSRLFAEGNEFFRQVRQTFEFYRKHLDDEYRQLSSQIESSHRLWIGCVGVGFAILLAGLLAVLFGHVAQGVLTSSASTMVYFIVRVFQRREDYYREEKAVKMKYLQYGNDWLLLIQSIEAIPDATDRLDQQRRLARVLLDRIKREDAGTSKPRAAVPAASARHDRHVRVSDKSALPVQIPDKANRPDRPDRTPDNRADPVRMPDKKRRRLPRTSKRSALSP
jgi:serine/threonine protein kinase